MAQHDQIDPVRWLKRAVALGVILLGWFFIAWNNSFNVTPPVVFVCLGYLALVATIYNLWRTGAAAASEDVIDADDSTWGKPMGAIGELEREKRTLLKAIKEAEFDHQMGKLSKVDADEMIAVYRERAIEVIKELEKLGRGGGRVGSKREQIEREVRARLELDKPQQRGEKKAGKRKAEKAAQDAGKRVEVATTKSVDEEDEDDVAAEAAEADAEAKPDDTKAAKLDDTKAAKPDDAKQDDAKSDTTADDVAATAAKVADTEITKAREAST